MQGSSMLTRRAWHSPTASAGLALALALTSQAAHALDGEVVATGLNQPLYLTAPQGDSRAFLVEKGGLIKVLSGGSVLPKPYLDLSAQIGTEGERGLLGLAFDPGYATNGRLYVDFIDKATNNTVIERYTVGTPGGNVANVASSQRVMTIPQESFSNHKAGWIAFRPGDASNLYIATGDGGSGNDPHNNAQNPESLLGKMLRIDVSGSNASYKVPASNPFVGQSGIRPEIWDLGLRNPWRNSFDRQTGDFWIGDVGQGAREEIDLERAGDAGGHNYGWRLREGTIATPGVGGDAPGLTSPVFDYGRPGHPGGLGGAITGGYVYRGPSILEADGRYFFGDYVANKLYSFLPDGQGHATDLRDETAAVLDGTGLDGLASLGEGGSGKLYVLGINGTVVSVVGAVPEPSSWALMIAGLGVLACTGEVTGGRRSWAATSASPHDHRRGHRVVLHGAAV